MGNTPGLDLAAQSTDGGGLADDRFKGGGPPAAVKCLIGHVSLLKTYSFRHHHTFFPKEGQAHLQPRVQNGMMQITKQTLPNRAGGTKYESIAA
jgi:hypothetical protein